MAETTEQRNYSLIEELRADIDFELDDVISNIVRDLPEEYFQRLKRSDQMTHLKALLAMSICHLEEEIVLRSNDDRHVAVVARQDYPGLLAKILRRLPADKALIGAKIFSSKTHEFIIDLFEFDSPDSEEESDSVDTYAIKTAIEEVVRLTGQSEPIVSEFASLYPANSRVLTCPDDLADQFHAFQKVDDESGIAVVTKAIADCEEKKTIVAANRLTAREVFQQSAQYLGDQAIDIQQAFLNDLCGGARSNIAVCSFQILPAADNVPVERTGEDLAEFLRSHPGYDLR